MGCKKGQYFSFDAIVGAVIFVMAISILLNHWYSLDSQMSEQTSFLQDEAIRLSEVLVSPGDYDVDDGNPNTHLAWYEAPKLAKRAGFGQNGSFEGNLVNDPSGSPSFLRAENYLSPNVNYDASRLLLATPVHYYAVFNLSIANPDDFSIGSTNILMPGLYSEIGRAPDSIDAEVVRITRPVASIFDAEIPTNPPQKVTAYYTGDMTLYVWMKGSRS